MKLPTWLEVVLGIGVVLAGASWFRAHEALRDALAQKDVIQHQRDDLQKQSDAAGAAEKKANDALEVARAKAATVQTVKQYLPEPLPNGSELQIVTPKVNCISDGTCVDSKPFIQLSGDPQANLNAIQDIELKCLECRNSLTARESQFADLQQQLKLSDENAKNWQKAANKGTGFWARTKEWGWRIGFAAGGYAAGKVMK